MGTRPVPVGGIAEQTEGHVQAGALLLAVAGVKIQREKVAANGSLAACVTEERPEQKQAVRPVCLSTVIDIERKKIACRVTAVPGMAEERPQEKQAIRVVGFVPVVYIERKEIAAER